MLKSYVFGYDLENVHVLRYIENHYSPEEYDVLIVYGKGLVNTLKIKLHDNDVDFANLIAAHSGQDGFKECDKLPIIPLQFIYHASFCDGEGEFENEKAYK